MPTSPRTARRSVAAPEITYSSLSSVPISRLVSCSTSALKAIYISAPEAVKSPTVPRGKDNLLAAVLTMREMNLTSSHPSQSQEDTLDTLLELSIEEVFALSSDDLPRLVRIIQHALQEDSNLQPRDFDHDNAAACAGVALAWKLRATESALDRVESRSQPVAQPDTPPPCVQDPIEVRNPLLTAGEPEQPPPKRRKVDFIGGVPLATQDSLSTDTAQVFRQGLGAHAAVTPSELQQYPGRASSLSTLRVNEIVGPAILKSLTQEGINVELAVRNRRWDKDPFNCPYPAEVEALTLARCVHLNLLSYESMWEALKSCPWMEVALRRLYSLLFVDSSVREGDGQVTRRAAWSMANRILEVHPSGGLRVPFLDSLVSRHAASSAKAMNALKSLGNRNQRDGGQRRNPRNQEKKQ